MAALSRQLHADEGAAPRVPPRSSLANDSQIQVAPCIAPVSRVDKTRDCGRSRGVKDVIQSGWKNRRGKQQVLRHGALPAKACRKTLYAVRPEGGSARNERTEKDLPQVRSRLDHSGRGYASASGEASIGRHLELAPTNRSQVVSTMLVWGKCSED